MVLTTVGGDVEQESREEAGVARSQHVVHVMPRDNARAARLITGVVERTATSEGPELLIVTPTASDAVAVARALAPREGEQRAVVPVTSARRGRRVLQTRPGAVAGAVGDLVELMTGAALKPVNLRVFVILWLDELIDADTRPRLEVLLAEVPREAERIVMASTMNEELERVLERFLWRARRVSHLEPESDAGVAVRYASVPEAGRGDTVRLLLDAFDPETCALVVFTDEGEREARRSVALLGYGTEGDGVRVVRGIPSEDAALVIAFEDMPSAAVLRELATRAPNVVALVSPSRMESFRAMAGSAATPLTFTTAFQAARAAEDVLRDEVRSVIQNGGIAAQVLQLEPLCEAYDPVEVAAAALFLLQRERQKTRRAIAAAAAAPRSTATAPASSATPGFTRLFLTVGERDGVRRGDLVGAITGETGITGAQIGKIDLRDTHTLVEISSEVAARVVERLNGTSIRGRRVVAREDREREASPRPRGGSRERGGKGERRGPARPFDDVGRAGEGGGRERRERRAPGVGDRLPRAAREPDEWAERGERLRNARRRPEEEA